MQEEELVEHLLCLCPALENRHIQNESIFQVFLVFYYWNRAGQIPLGEAAIGFLIRLNIFTIIWQFSPPSSISVCLFVFPFISLSFIAFHCVVYLIFLSPSFHFFFFSSNAGNITGPTLQQNKLTRQCY